VLGFVLLTTGLYMSLTWPVQNVPADVVEHRCAADNITFGEPSRSSGRCCCSAVCRSCGPSARLRLGLDAARPHRPSAPAGVRRGVRRTHAVRHRRGRSLAGIWTAPASEPIAGEFEDTIVETAFVTACYVLTRTAAVLAPFAPGAQGRRALAGGAAVLSERQPPQRSHA